VTLSITWSKAPSEAAMTVQAPPSILYSVEAILESPLPESLTLAVSVTALFTDAGLDASAN
jgi:hypothetical protein